MKKLLLWFVVAGFVLAASLSGYKILQQTRSSVKVKPEAPMVAKSSMLDASDPSAELLPVDAPRSVVSKSASQSEPAVQVVAAPGDRWQLFTEAQVSAQRIKTVSHDRKTRELLVNAGGKYPFRRVEETLVKNDGVDTYTIASRTEMVADHVLVKLQDGKSTADLQVMLESYGVSILRELALPGHYIVSLKAPTLDAVPEALSVFAGEMELLAYVEPDYFSQITAVPNDTRWSDLWGMVKINATGAWDAVTGSTNVIVAVIDTGIDLTHPDLVSNLWKNAAEANGTTGADDDGNGKIDDVNGWDFVNDDNSPNDDQGHGTHCAGTIGAVGNNGQGVAGVCWTVRLMALKALSAQKDGLNSDIAEAIQYAADKGARIINASYGGQSFSETERAAVSYANSKGVLFVAAAGNAGANNDVNSVYPAGYDLPNIVAVAATDQNDALASFSNYGQTSVDLAAPGVGIYSTVPDSYSTLDGTSMATPHVAGAAALLLSAKPALTPLQIKEALLNTVDLVPALATKTVSSGRLNVKKLIALQDTDGDGMPDSWELANGLNPNNAFDATLNPDNDHLNNRGEYENRCNPNVADTDTDTLVDGWEVTCGFNPNSPTGGLAASSSLGAFGISSGSKNVAVAGNYAYVAAGSAGLIIVNISNPESPVLAGSYTAKTANDVAVSNGYAYVASGGNTDGANGLLVLNVYDPASPTRSGFLKTTNGTARGVTIQGSYAYLADGRNELVVINVSNPASPSKAGNTSSVIRDFADVFVSGGSAYIAMNEDVRRYNISNPASISHTAAALGGYTGDNVLCVHGNGVVLAAAIGAKGVSLLNPNTANLVNMTKLIPGNGLYDTDGTASGVFVSGNYVYVADGGNGLVVLDISTPSAPVQVVQIATEGSANGVFVRGDKVYVATSTGLEVLSILPDTDSDGMLDSWEMTWFGNLLQNGTDDYDNDGISNWGEYLAGLDPTSDDQDGDGLIDGTQEVRIYNTDPRVADTDGDGLTDGDEVSRGTNPRLKDTDGDGMNDGWEVRYGFDPLDPLSPGSSSDADGDGLTNLEESQNNTDPTNRDTDGDGMWDGWEVDNGLNPLVDDSALDPDADGLTNLKEYQLGTNPKNSDSDGDGMPDGWEVDNGFDPLANDASADADSDGLTNLGEYQNSTDPNNPDTDADGMPDGWEVNHGLSPTSANGVNGASGDPDSDKLLNIQEYNLFSSNLWMGVYASVTGAPATFFFGPPPTNPTPGMPGSTHPNNPDSDGDGLSDYYEITTNATGNLFITNPNNADTDGDGLPDKWEIENYPASNPVIPALPTDDSDGDGLTNAEEEALGSDPVNALDPIWVDDDAPNDPWPSDPEVSDPLADGSKARPFDSIQKAVEVSRDGMMVLVNDGWYAFTGNYAIDTKGKAITIRSKNGPVATAITSLGMAEVFRFTSGETTNTVIKGFTIRSNQGQCSDGDCDWVDIVYINNSSPRIEDCVIASGGQSGVKCVGDSRPWLVSCTISAVRNGVWCEGGASPVIISNRIENAYVTHGWTFAENWGNGIYAVDANGLTVLSTTIESCEGRGIHIQSSRNLLVEDSAILGNRGGFWLNGTDGIVRRTRIENNQAPNYYKQGDLVVRSSQSTPEDEEDHVFENENGGGFLLTSGSRIRLENALIAGNRTWAWDPDFNESKLVPDYGLGGGLYIGEGCSATGVNITVSGNIAMTRGGGVSSHERSFFRNAIVWGNSAFNMSVSADGNMANPDPRWNELHCRSGNITIWHGNIGYPYYSDPKIYQFGVVITNNPQFVGVGNYRLSGSSPCIDAGSPADAPLNDLEGNVRPLDGNNDGIVRHDFGAYEYVYNDTLLDSDGDGMPDGWEVANGLNPAVNDAALDPDLDGLTNLQEYTLGTNPQSADTDGDGMPDGWEVANGFDPLVNDCARDTDSDGLSDYYEMTTNAAITNLYITLPNNPDTDGDGMPDGWENRYAWPTDALSPVSTNGNHGANGDPDTDGLSNLLEYQWGTNPRLPDTDGDGVNDGDEVANGTDPANRYDPVYVDEKAPGDPEAGNPNISNTNENGSVTYPFDSIQKAISSTNTVSGMTVLVADGLYEGTGNYSINPGGKNLKIRSVNGSSNTLIKTHAYGPAFIINSGETTNTIIQGFTIETQGDRAPEEGIVVDGASPVITNCVIHNCELEAVSCINGAAPQILNSRFYNVPNGLFADGSAGVLLQQCVISNTSGRGIVIKDDDLAKVTWSTITNCAGGITLDNSDASIRQCFIRGNEAPNYYTINGITIASRSLFDGSVLGSADITDPDENGAGVLLLNGSSPLLQNCLIAGNKTWADDPAYSATASAPAFGLGAGIYIGTGCNPTGVNCTVVDNHANTRGGGLSSAGRPLFRNMIIWDNTASNATIVLGARSMSVVDPNIHLADEVINIWYSNIEGGHDNAVQCITNDPLFDVSGDYSLQAGSPCVDAGTYYLAPKVDLATNSRPWNPTNFPDRVDMGCYEDGTGTVTNWIALGAELALEAPEADPLMDTDGDGVSNGAEMSAGTDIYNSDSYFRVYNEQVVAGGSVLISWQSTPGYAYAVQTTSSLMSPWTTVTNMTGTGAVMSFTGDMPTDAARYYRVLVRKP